MTATPIRDVGATTLRCASLTVALACLSSCNAVMALPPPGDRVVVAAVDHDSATHRQVFAALLNDAATRTQQPVGRLRITSVEAVTWPDSSLGCPRPGMAAMQVLTPGQRVRIGEGASVNSNVYDYHLGPRGAWVFCPPERAQPPLPPGAAGGGKGTL